MRTLGTYYVKDTELSAKNTEVSKVGIWVLKI